MPAKYVLAFVLDPLLVRVALIHKHRGPKTAIGWNGIGGHVDEGETEPYAATRETLEEANVLVSPERWTFLQTMQRPNGDVAVFAAATPAIHHARSRTDEEVVVFHVTELPPKEEIASDATWWLSVARTRLRAIHHPDWRVS